MTSEGKIIKFKLSVDEWLDHLKEIANGDETWNKKLDEFIRNEAGTIYHYGDDYEKKLEYRDLYFASLYMVLWTWPKRTDYILYHITNMNYHCYGFQTEDEQKEITNEGYNKLITTDIGRMMPGLFNLIKSCSKCNDSSTNTENVSS
ncbi:MAG: hypothetical protein Edafosvirus4_65 [Edafosvirus sp.]|uniref:Uncharacterized protein n=1 Tax=Edafosvirus sp. TaxID=2487765 RepID=A0A3G4ZVQ9_9VIRU|nr:MAG: hypothetical protein Edafosvirus4_65 [Edafosvirus sp.]